MNNNNNHLSHNHFAEEIRVFNPYLHPNKNSNGECLKGGFIALAILLSINLLLFLLALIMGTEARIIFRSVATFPLSQLHLFASDIQLEKSWIISLLFLLGNSVIYFIAGAFIGFIVKKTKQLLKKKK